MNLYLGINIGIGLFFIFMFVKGVKVGFLLQLANMLGLIVALLLSSYFSGTFAKMFNIWPKELGIDEYEIFNKLFYKNLNEFAWFIITFLVISLIFMLIKPLVKFLQDIPIIKQLNALLGGILGILTANLWTLMIIFILSLPLVNNGLNIIDNTFFKDIKTINTHLMGEYIKPLIESEKFTRIIQDFDNLSEDDKSWLEEWIIQNNIDDINLEELFKLK